jgi:acetoacetyl-CoA synthetase
MLATTSIGAIWSSCSPDFGLKSITDRFNQINPKIIFSNRSYQYNGNTFNFDEKLNDIVSNLQSLENVILVEKEYKKPLSNNYLNFSDLLDNDCAHIIFEKFPFDHPVFILYTSGTTGLPKSIVHGAGGTLLQHKKELLFHCNVSPKDIVFYYTTCGWMMWNWLASFLSTGSTIVLYDGSPFFPNKKSMWNLIDELNITIFGTSAKFIDACKNSNTSPKNFSKLSSLKQILSTGSPLVPESFDYVYDHIKEDVLLGSISGGTDIISCFVLNNPTLPVYRGEIQCRGLGMDVDSFDETGKAVRNQKGELVCKTPFPSMPVSFWDDDNGEKFNNAYFNKYQNTWAHGDFIEINDHGGVIIYGRSDATLNPGGVRIGTAEIYRIVETFKEVEDSLVVGQEWENDQRIILFLKISSRGNFSKLLLNTIKQTIKTSCSPRHVPSIILPVKDIPYTISGKKVELAVKNIIQGNEVFNKDALANPESLDLFRAIPELS